MRLAVPFLGGVLTTGLLLAPTPASALTIDPQPTGLADVFGASTTGRYVLGGTAQ